MILKSYIVEQNVEILKKYQSTLIYGENTGLKDDIQEKIKENNQECEIIILFENDISRNNILYENISNQSLFTERKIIFIKEATDKIINEIEECLEKNNKEVQIYIFANNLEKKSKLRNLFEKDKNLAIFACYEDNERTLISYIDKELIGFKGLTGEIVNAIINNSGMNRRVIKSEILKIKDYFIDKKINKEQILEILNVKNDTGFNEIRDKALMGEKEKVNKLLSETEILSDEAFFYLNTLNYRILRLHEIARKDKQNNNEQKLESLKPPIFWKDKPIILKQLSKWSHKKLEGILLVIAETEVLMKKNSYLKNDVVIKDLVIKLTSKASATF